MSQNLNRLEALWNKRRGVDNHSPAHVARYATVSFLSTLYLLEIPQRSSVFWQGGCSQISMSWLESNCRLKSNRTGSVWTATLGGENECDRHRTFKPGDVLRVVGDGQVLRFLFHGGFNFQLLQEQSVCGLIYEHFIEN